MVQNVLFGIQLLLLLVGKGMLLVAFGRSFLLPKWFAVRPDCFHFLCTKQLIEPSQYFREVMNMESLLSIEGMEACRSWAMHILDSRVCVLSHIRCAAFQKEQKGLQGISNVPSLPSKDVTVSPHQTLRVGSGLPFVASGVVLCSQLRANFSGRLQCPHTVRVHENDLISFKIRRKKVRNHNNDNEDLIINPAWIIFIFIQHSHKL